MNFKTLYVLAALVFASFIQVGCGTATPTTALGNNMGSVCSQYGANGTCLSYSQPGINNGVNSCMQGPSYYSNQASCGVGYIYQNGQCVCQANGGINGNNGNGVNGQNQCGSPGYFMTQFGCFPQGPCPTGTAYVTPYGLCYMHY